MLFTGMSGPNLALVQRKGTSSTQSLQEQEFRIDSAVLADKDDAGFSTDPSSF